MKHLNNLDAGRDQHYLSHCWLFFVVVVVVAEFRSNTGGTGERTECGPGESPSTPRTG